MILAEAWSRCGVAGTIRLAKENPGSDCKSIMVDWHCGGGAAEDDSWGNTTSEKDLGLVMTGDMGLISEEEKDRGL